MTTALLVIGGLMACSSSIVCAVAVTDGQGFSGGGFLLFLVGMLIYGAGRALRAHQG